GSAGSDGFGGTLEAFVEPLVELEAEIGGPEWVFGVSRYAVLPDGRIAFARSSGGFDALAMRLADGTIVELDLPFTQVRMLRAAGSTSFVTIAGSGTEEAGIYRVDLGDGAVVDSV